MIRKEVYATMSISVQKWVCTVDRKYCSDSRHAKYKLTKDATYTDIIITINLHCNWSKPCSLSAGAQ